MHEYEKIVNGIAVVKRVCKKLTYLDEGKTAVSTKLTQQVEIEGRLEEKLSKRTSGISLHKRSSIMKITAQPPSSITGFDPTA